MDKVGHQLEKYRLVALLGRGSFAEVYLGQHIQIHNLYAAIKILHTRLSESYQDGFRREAEIIADLRHPNIIRILDYGIDPSDNSPYLSMDYARQGTLRKHHPKGSTIPLETLLSYVKQIASALQYAHDRHLIHRDLKPENLLLGENDEMVVSDFGIATVVHATSTLETSAYSGTAAYSAPEQILGKPRVQSDQYALGIILYEWLTGELPFHGSFPELCAQHLHASPQPLHEKVPSIPREVEEVIMMALAKDPHQRFQRIQAFAKALEQAYALSSSPTLRAEKPVPNHPTPTEERPIHKPEHVPLQEEIVSIPPQQSAGETPLRIHEETNEKYQEPVSSQGTPNEGKPEQATAQKEAVSASEQSMRERASSIYEEQAHQTQEEKHYLAEEAEQARKREEKRQQKIEEEQTRLVEIERARYLAEEEAPPAKVEEHTPSTQPPLQTSVLAQQSRQRIVPTPPATPAPPISRRTRVPPRVGIGPQSITLVLALLGLFLTLLVTVIGVVKSNIYINQVHATATAAAPQTATAVAANPYPSYLPGSGKLALYDPLSHPDNWSPGVDSSLGGKAQFTQGAYRISLSTYGIYTLREFDHFFSNFAFEVQMTNTKCDCGGVMFRYDNTKDSNYFFEVCQDGSYHLLLYADNPGKNTQTLASGSPKAIYTGYNQINLIAVVANGNSLDLYVNNQKVGSASDATYSTSLVGTPSLFDGTIALCAHDDNTPTEVIYRNVRVWTL